MAMSSTAIVAKLLSDRLELSSEHGQRVMGVLLFQDLAVVPLLTGVLDATARLALVLLLLFAFNLSRGISSCAWLPWITALVPEHVRGRYLTRDAACVNLASFLVIVLVWPWFIPWRQLVAAL